MPVQLLVAPGNWAANQWLSQALQVAWALGSHCFLPEVRGMTWKRWCVRATFGNVYQTEPHGVTGKAANRSLTLKSFSPKSEAGFRRLCGSDRNRQVRTSCRTTQGLLCLSLPSSTSMASGLLGKVTIFELKMYQVLSYHNSPYPVQATFKPCHLRDTDSMTVRKEKA